MAGSTIREQAPGLADSLIEALNDRDETVRQTIVTSLVDMGRHKLDVILSSGHSFLIKHPKLSRSHRVLILQVLETVCKEHVDKVSSQLAVDLISLASRELTASSDVVPEWQTAASSLLTTLGLRYADKVLAELMLKFPPGGHPHYFVVRSLGLLAVANAKAVVPSLNTVIARMLPMLSQAKHDNMQWVFSSTIAMFCESILEYLADKELAMRTRISAEGFEGSVYSAYEHMYSQWLPSKESKLRVVVVGALGYSAKLLSPQHLDEQLPKLVPSILQLYKKHSEHYALSQGMCNILEAAAEKSTPSLQGLLDTILVSLHTFACVPLDPSSSVSIRNQSELLRCFTVLSEGFPDRVISFLLSKLEGEKEKVRLPTLNIIKHVINSCGDKLEDRRPLIVNGLKILLLETNLKVRSVFAQAIISMASHRYLSVEGGRLMIEFVVKQCAMDIGKDPPPGKGSGAGDVVTPRQIRDMNEHVLRMISTTIPHMDEVLWPFLLEFVKPMEYTEAFGILTRCIAHIGGKKRDSDADDYFINFDEQVNVPKREEMIARLFVMAGNPSNGRGRGEHVLQCLQVLGPNLAPPPQSDENEEESPLIQLWDTTIPKMLYHLNEHKEKETWNQKQWEDLVLKLLSKTLDVVGEEEWVVEVGRCFGAQVPLYEAYPEEKSFAYKCLGMVMLKSSHKEFVQDHLSVIFSSVNHASQEEREGCAYGFGFCASSHLDQVMLKLEQVTRDELAKKTKGFFSFGRDKSDAELERMKSTVMLCYGYVTYHSPPHLITARIEVNIWRNINPHFAKVKDTLVKQNLIRAMDLIGRSLHIDHLKKTFVFNKRVDLINHLLAYIKEEAPNAPITTETRALAMDAQATLVKLEPHLTEAEQFDIIKTSLDHTLAVPPLVASSEKKGREPAFQQAMLDSARLTEGALSSASKLLVAILLREMSSRNLLSIFKHLAPWLGSSDGTERERGSALLVDLMDAYQTQHATMEESGGLDILGHLVGRLVPRATDPQLAVRQAAIHCIQVCLRLGTCEQGKADKMVDALSVLKQRATADDPTALFTLVSDLGKVLCKKVPDSDLWELACALMDGLLDYQANSSNGACVVLNSVLKHRGPALQSRLPELLDSLHDKLGCVTNPQTKTGTLRCVRTLALLFTVPVVTHLLNKPLNYEPIHVTTDMWTTLGSDKQLVNNIFNHMLETLTLGQPYQEKAKGNSGEIIRMDTPLPRAITAALIILFKVEEAKEPLKELYPKFLPVLLARIGNSLNLQPVDPKAKERTSMSLAVEALRVFLVSTDSELIMEAMDTQSGWTLFESFPTFPHAVMIVAHALGVHYRQSMLKVVEVVSGSLSSVYENQRIMAVSFYSQLLRTLSAGDVDLAEQLMNYLLGRQVDLSYVVRMICIQGLGNMADINGSQVSKFSTTILSALMAGMDDREDPEDLITMEAMSGLAKVFEKIEESCVRPILINISLRIRPCFEKPLPSVRAAAFRLFGSLARFSDGPSRGPFLEQVQTNFVSLLLHLNEEDPFVIAACKVALTRLGPLLGSERISQLFQNNLSESSTLLYGEFLNSFCKLMVVDFTDRINFYVMDAVSFFRNPSPYLRGNASLLVGFALGHLPEERIPIISKEHICDALILLLKDPAENVRCCAAEAISMLHRY